MQHGSYQNPLVCHGHSRPIVELDYSRITEDGVFLISASKGASPLVLEREERGASRLRLDVVRCLRASVALMFLLPSRLVVTVASLCFV